MRITKDVVAGIHYIIRDETGEVIDQTPSDRPWFFLHGADECPPGLEKALLHLEPGSKVQVQLPPEETYGTRNEDAVFRLDRSTLPSDKTPEVGMLVSLVSPKGETEMRIVEVNTETIKVDANHPLAGRTLTFDVEVAAVRRAFSDELLENSARQQ